MTNFKSFSDFVNEGKVQLKRKYTENRPAFSVSEHAPSRHKILAFVKEKGSVTESELKEYIKLVKEESGRAPSAEWLRKNKDKFFTVKEGNYTLNKYGEKFLDHKNLNESEEDMDETDFEYFEDIEDVTKLSEMDQTTMIQLGSLIGGAVTIGAVLKGLVSTYKQLKKENPDWSTKDLIATALANMGEAVQSAKSH